MKQTEKASTTDLPHVGRGTLVGEWFRRHRAYPVREQGGLIFAYLGASGDHPPPLPEYLPLMSRERQRAIGATGRCALCAALTAACSVCGRKKNSACVKVLSKYTKVTEAETLSRLQLIYGRRYSGERIPFVRPESVEEILKRTPGKEVRDARAGDFIDNSLLQESDKGGWFKAVGK